MKLIEFERNYKGRVSSVAEDHIVSIEDPVVSIDTLTDSGEVFCNLHTTSGRVIQLKGTRAEVVAKLGAEQTEPEGALKDVRDLLNLVGRSMPTIWAASDKDNESIQKDAEEWSIQACALHRRLSAKYTGTGDKELKGK